MRGVFSRCHAVTAEVIRSWLLGVEGRDDDFLLGVSNLLPSVFGSAVSSRVFVIWWWTSGSAPVSCSFLGGKSIGSGKIGRSSLFSASVLFPIGGFTGMSRCSAAAATGASGRSGNENNTGKSMVKVTVSFPDVLVALPVCGWSVCVRTGLLKRIPKRWSKWWGSYLNFVSEGFAVNFVSSITSMSPDGARGALVFRRSPWTHGV